MLTNHVDSVKLDGNTNECAKCAVKSATLNVQESGVSFSGMMNHSLFFAKETVH